MVSDIARAFNYQLKHDETFGLLRDLWREGRNLMIGIIGANIVGSIVKSIPLLGTLAGAVIQAGAAGYFCTVLGKAAIVYFENNKSWGDKGLRQVLQEIIQNTDKKSVTRPIVERVKKQLREKKKTVESTDAELEKNNEAVKR